VSLLEIDKENKFYNTNKDIYVDFVLSECIANLSLFKLSSNARVCRSSNSLVGALKKIFLIKEINTIK